MEGSWWKEEKDIKDEQKAIVNLKPDGKYLVLGPPGSGKTNLLLLRLKWLAASGKKNVLFLTMGRSLSEFIKTGVGAKKIVEPEQIRTVMRWAMDLAADSAPNLLSNMPDSYEDRRKYFTEHLTAITAKMPNGYYDAIVVDEIQDLQGSELSILERLSSRVMAAGDSRQSIYSGNGIDAALNAGFELKELQFHYRIGKKICSVADTVYPPDGEHPSLLQKCQYDEKLPSSAEPVQCGSLEEQCKKLVVNIRVQLKSYPGESVGVLVPTFKNGILDAVRDALDSAEFNDIVEYHGEDGRVFPPNKRVFVLTCHSAKGMEFRAVNLVAAERMYSGYLSKRTLQFTSVTRAKTSLRVYYTGKLPLAMATAFSTEHVPDISSII
jgi:superfamily I DNA/RNA helicase